MGTSPRFGRSSATPARSGRSAGSVMPSTDPPSEMPKPDRARPTIARQIGSAMALVAFIAVLILGAVGAPLVSRNATNLQRTQLANSADLVRNLLNNPRVPQPSDPSNP